MKQSPSLNPSRDSPFLDCSAFGRQESLTNELLNAALVFYFIFAVVHSALPALLQRRRGATTQTWANHLFPILALALVLVPVFKLAEVSFIVWPFILLVDLLAIALAVLTATLLPVLAVLLLTLAATGALIFKIPSDLTGLPVSFFLLGAFAVFFVAAGIWLVRKFKPDALKTGIKFGNDLAAPGRFGRDSARVLHRAAVPAAHHGHAAAAADQSVAGLRPGAVAGRAVAWRHKIVFARLDARRRPGLRDARSNARGISTVSIPRIQASR